MQTKFTDLTDCQWEVIEKMLKDHRPRQHSLRTIINAILWLSRTGSQWRNLESKYPPWQSVYYYFRLWQHNGVWDRLLASLVRQERKRQGRDADPSAVAIDSQSVKGMAFISEESRGIDGNKKIKGRKRHLITDTMGLPLAIFVSSADWHDGKAGIEMLWQLEPHASRVKLIRGDKAYGGEFKEIAESIYEYQVDTTQKPPSAKGFIPQPGRWPIERSFGWLQFFRRLARDYEKTTQSARAFLQIAFINVVLNRLS